MKKYITALTALTLAAALLTGCELKYINSDTSTENTSSTTTTSTSESPESTSPGSTESTTESTTIQPVPEPAPKKQFIYGEKEITDTVYPEYQDDGRAIVVGEEYQPGLDSMVFETHTFGDYTIRLVGDNVRTDKKNFPGVIYAQELYIEAEKNGAKLHDEMTDYDYIRFQSPYGGQFSREYIIYENQIGNYLAVYDMKHPVIALRYFNADNFDESIRKLVHFAWIEDEAIVARFFGDFAENTGVIAGVSEFPHFSKHGQFAVFAADEFKVENENTLVDEVAGIRYIFDFDKTDDTGHYFSTDKIG